MRRCCPYARNGSLFGALLVLLVAAPLPAQQDRPAVTTGERAVVDVEGEIAALHRARQELAETIAGEVGDVQHGAWCKSDVKKTIARVLREAGIGGESDE